MADRLPPIFLLQCREGRRKPVRPYAALAVTDRLPPIFLFAASGR